MEAATLGKVASNFQPLLLFFVLVFFFSLLNCFATLPDKTREMLAERSCSSSCG
jgi:hypothetical protein